MTTQQRRALPAVNIHEPRVVGQGMLSPAHVAPPPFETAVAAHMFEPELAANGLSSVRRRVRYTARARRVRAALFSIAGLALAMSLALMMFYEFLGLSEQQAMRGGVASMFFLVKVLWHLVFSPNADRYNNDGDLRWLRDGAAIAGYVVSLSADGPNRKTPCVARVRYWRAPNLLTEEDIPVTRAVHDHLTPGATLTLIQHPSDTSRARPYYQFNTVEAV